jgi:DNA-binding MarR family transcriptional regulator
VRVKIVDQNVEYLHDYAAILVEEGFKAKIHAEKLTVRSYCTWLNLLTLYEIGAFRGTRSWTKLLCSLKIAIAGKQTRGYERIRELSELETITSRDVCTRYRIGGRAANLWLRNMQKQGLIERSANIRTDRYNRYCLTQHGKTAIALIRDFEREYNEMSKQHASSGPVLILRACKTKTGVPLRSTEEGTQSS